MGDGAERERLRASFDEVAELYDRARRGYPAALVDDLVGAARLQPGSRVVEIGPGTGQATRALSERHRAWDSEVRELLYDRIRARIARRPRRDRPEVLPRHPGRRRAP